MNKYFWLLLTSFCLTSLHINAQNTITVYYDEDWKGVPTKDFAYHELIYIEPNESNYKKRFRLNYIEGQKEGEGEYVSIDKDDFSQSTLGSYKMFYKNGEKLCEYKINQNKVNFIEYYPTGLVKSDQTFVNNAIDGVSYFFTEDGKSCFQTLYNNGKIAKPYYTYITSDGYVTKYKVKDNTLFSETPLPSERKLYNDGNTSFSYYCKNGITVASNAYIGTDYVADFTFGATKKYIMANYSTPQYSTSG